MKKRYFVYILMSDNGTVLYVGVTGRLSRRVDQHAAGFGCEFTSKYHVTRLVYFEQFGEARDAITREKQIKGWTRKKKEELIRRLNPKLQDLRPKILDPQM